MFASAAKLICRFSLISRHLFFESQILGAIFFTKWRIQTFRLPHFYHTFKKSTACPMPVDVDKKVSFNHSILCCGRTLTNPSSKTAIKPLIVLVKRHKTVKEF